MGGTKRSKSDAALLAAVKAGAEAAAKRGRTGARTSSERSGSKMKTGSSSKSSASKMSMSRTSSTRVSAPAASQRTVSRDATNVVLFRDTERLAPVVGRTAFAVSNTFIMQPGLSDAFPQLNGHAILFDQYRINSIRYTFKTTRGTTAGGNIMMSYDSDTTDAAPTNSVIMANLARSADGPVWKEMSLYVPCDKKWRFTRALTQLQVESKQYDSGVVYVATEGCDTDGLAIGYLDVQYEIEFKHKSPAALQSATLKGPSQFFGTAASVAAGANYVFADAANSVGAVAAAGGGLTLKAGTYKATVNHYNTTNQAAGQVNTISLKLNGVAIPVVIANPYSTTASSVANPHLDYVFTITTDQVFAVVNGMATADASGADLQLIIEKY